MQLRSEAGFPSIRLRIRQSCQIVETLATGRQSAKVRTIAYSYDILDREGRELLAYHWHPRTVGPLFSHLHISSRIGTLPVGRNVRPVALGEMHLPTSHVPFGAVVRLLITEFQIAPRRGDWEATLTAGEATLATKQSPSQRPAIAVSPILQVAAGTSHSMPRAALPPTRRGPPRHTHQSSVGAVRADRVGRFGTTVRPREHDIAPRLHESGRGATELTG